MIMIKKMKKMFLPLSLSLSLVVAMMVFSAEANAVHAGRTVHATTTATATYTAATQPDTIRYIDDRKMSTEWLVKNVTGMISENPHWGISTFRGNFDTLAHYKKIRLDLPPAVDEFMPADEMYVQRAP